eukprot:296869-Prymnesium_polylepis.1
MANYSREEKAAVATPRGQSAVEAATSDVAACKKRVEVAEAVLARERDALRAAEKRLADAKQKAAAAPAAAKPSAIGLGS